MRLINNGAICAVKSKEQRRLERFRAAQSRKERNSERFKIPKSTIRWRESNGRDILTGARMDGGADNA